MAKVAGDRECEEYDWIVRALNLHEQTARLYEAHGMRRLADEEWKKVSLLNWARRTWLETWEFPSKECCET